ncbi:ATP-binding protein [Methylobacterium nodulans]|uniref:ATP-binding protein n=1 Tax=Methylobacterium nodulans TaxID=114616 RepID=UPI0012ED0DF4|nr:ATP-binding protein [Methylobacterium nodulans]
MLYALGAIRRLDDIVRVTNAGILIFGKAASIRRLFPAHRVDYIRVPGKTWVQDPEAKIESVDMRGSIVSLIGRVIAAITDDLPRTLDIDEKSSGQRTEIPILPFRVIREAVVNALMHRNYQFNQPVQVIRYANRIVIKNPGYSLKSPERLGEPGSSIRNPNISAILHDTRFAETKGSGIRVMQAKMKQRGLAAPTFESNRDTDEFSATFLFHHFLDSRDIDWLSRFKDFDLTEDQMKALIFVREVGAIDNATYRSLTSMDTLQASKSLRSLRKLDLLLDRGSGARTYYIAGTEMLSRDMPEKRQKPTGEAIHDRDDIMDGAIHDKDNLLKNMPVSLRVAVRNAEAKKRLNPQEAKDLIEAMCRSQALSLQQIAVLINKTSEYISQRYIASMIAEGRLTYLHPEMIQHPQQKYRAAKPSQPSKQPRR